MILAATTMPADQAQWVLILSAVIILSVIVLGAAVLWIRRRSFASVEAGEPAFDLGQLQEMRKLGTISEQEFRQLRRLALGLPEQPLPSDPPGRSAKVEKDGPPLTEGGQDDDQKDNQQP